MVSSSTIVIRSREILASKLEGQTVMMNIQKGAYYGLESLESAIWEMLEAPISVADLCDKLQQEFDVDAETCSADVIEFLNEMVAESLVETCDAA